MGVSVESGQVTPAPHLQELAEGVYAYIQPDGGWCVSNAGALIGPEGVTLIDATATVPRALLFRKHLDRVTDRPVKMLVVTHRHGDHHYGAAALAPDAMVVAHDNARDSIEADGLNLLGIWPQAAWGDVRLRVPELTYREQLTLHVGDTQVQLWHPGPAHTTGDTLAWLPQQRILFAGDVTFHAVTPLVMMGSVAGTLRTLRQLRDLDPQVVVSGHGPLGGPEVIDSNIDYLTWVQHVAADAFAAGLTPLQAAQQTDLGRFKALLDSERLVANLHRAYSELRGEPEGVELDNYAVLGDVVACNGGAPPACLA
ncbi:MBL fold metallo-hydrolase [Catellatospora citrea]|uniref:MBL fold metallo-hydrolase n=1 Tax=Catellatospora citrea TaxID=53366 RepID=UPI0033F41D4A